MKKEAGFTLVEILAVVVLLGLLLSLIWNVMVQNAFQQKRVQNEIEVNQSAKALLNHIGEIVMEQNIPIVQQIDSYTYVAGTVEDSDVKSIKFTNGEELKKEGKSVSFDGRTYNYIKNISVKVNERSLDVVIEGESDKAKVEFSNTFYSRNT